jgi:hypothetical protein
VSPLAKSFQRSENPAPDSGIENVTGWRAAEIAADSPVWNLDWFRSGAQNGGVSV